MYNLECVGNYCGWVFNYSTLHMSIVFVVRKFVNIHTYFAQDILVTQWVAILIVIERVLVDTLVDFKIVYNVGDI